MKLIHKIGDIVNHKYRILDTLGQGGIGITYLSEDLENKEKLALKVLSLHRINDWKKLELFEREANILSQLNCSEIPRYLDYFHIETDTDNSFYIAQQLAPGKSLEKLIENGWNPDEEEVKTIAIQILDILIYLQSFSPPIIHRDIKPENIIRDQNGKIFLVDFGAVTDTYHNTITAGSTVVGTFGYMAPEQFRSKALPATDLYGLGTTLLYLLTKKHPADLPQKHLKIDFRKQIKVSRNFANWLDKILEPDAKIRFPDANVAYSVLQGKESIDNYPLNKPYKPKKTSISLRKSENELQIEIPPGKFRNNFMLFIVMFILLVHGLLLSTFIVTISNIPLINLITDNWIFIIIFFILGCLSKKFIISKNFLLHPLSRITLDIYKYDNRYYFHCQKWLLSWCYQRHKIAIHTEPFISTWMSLTFNLTSTERTWLKTEINSFVNKKLIM